LATTVPLSAFGAAVADPTATRKTATASRAVDLIDDSFFSVTGRPRVACGLYRGRGVR